METGELMKVMGMSVLSVFVVVQARHHYGATGTATCGGGKRILKQGAIGRQRINGRCFGHGIAITTEGWAFIVGDEKNDVLFGGPTNRKGNRQEQQNG